MKKPKVDKKQDLRNFTQVKDILPDKLLASLKVREAKPPKLEEPTNQDALEKNVYVQDPLFDEWPSEEQLATFDFGVGTEKLFKETTPVKMPPSTSELSDSLVTFKRYKDYLKAFMEKSPGRVSKRGLVKMNSGHDLGESAVRKGLTASRLRAGNTVLLDHDRLDEGDFQRFDDDRVDIKVCDYFERPETTEEAEERKKKEEANLKGKKKPVPDKKKGGQAEEEAKHVTKEPSMGYISLKGPKPDFSRWIGSILEVIKDRNIKDCYTNRSILKNIYPQVDGVPVYNSSGRYWVKLYYLGKARKIEIDDVFPFDGFTFRFLYPMAEYANILWPLILSKALFKLFSFKWKYEDVRDEVGEGAVMYSLTGLLPCTFKIDQLKQDWSLMEEALNQFNFSNNRAYLVGYCSRKHKPVVPSNIIDKRSAFKIMSRQSNYTASPTHKRPRLDDDEHEELHEFPARPLDESMEGGGRGETDTGQVEGGSLLRSQQPTYVESNIQSGLAYNIFDCFTNNKFNMVYVQKIADWEIKMRREYLEALKETTNRKSREQILEIKKKRRDLRARIKDEDKKRVDLITREPLSYRLFRVVSNLVDQKALMVMCPFNEEEIYTAKKCLANKLMRPPNYYDFYEEKKDDKSNMSAGNNPANTNSQQAAIENSIAAALRPLTDFSKLNNPREPEDRGRGGTWVLDSDLLSVFEYIQVYYNPRVYKYLRSDYYPADRERMNNFKVDNEVIVFEEIKEEEGDHASDHSIEFVFSFNPSSFNKVETLKSHCLLEKYDFDNLTSVSSHTTLSGTVDSIRVVKQNENSVFRTVVYCPTSYALTLASNAKFRTMSMPSYLSSFQLTGSRLRTLARILIQYRVQASREEPVRSTGQAASRGQHWGRRHHS